MEIYTETEAKAIIRRNEAHHNKLEKKRREDRQRVEILKEERELRENCEDVYGRS